jgi:hypothetical protein
MARKLSGASPPPSQHVHQAQRPVVRLHAELAGDDDEGAPRVQMALTAHRPGACGVPARTSTRPSAELLFFVPRHRGPDGLHSASVSVSDSDSDSATTIAGDSATTTTTDSATATTMDSATATAIATAPATASTTRVGGSAITNYCWRRRLNQRPERC